jgi:hypothetical protein
MSREDRAPHERWLSLPAAIVAPLVQPPLDACTRTMAAVVLLPATDYSRARKSRRKRTLGELEGAGPTEPHEPMIRGPKRRLDARAHLGLVRFRREEQRAEDGDVARGIDCVVVRPRARAVVLCAAAELHRHCSAYLSWISSWSKRDRCFVNVGDALGYRRA